MKTIEYRNVDKSGWPAGEWQDEPDKVQWQDAATGLPCLIVRNGSGALCGYVGVAVGHPCYDLGYGAESATLASALEARKEKPIGENPGMGIMLACLLGKVEASPEIVFEVHGGLTFSGVCSETTLEAWEKWRARLLARRDEADKYPIGDAARYFRDYAKELDDYNAWVTKKQSESICHLSDAGDPDRVWWLGFDCSHYGDLSPEMERRYADGGTYRNIEYVKRECASLARQLSEVAG